MEVMPTTVSISEFRLRPVSSVEAVSIMETAKENTTLKFAVKTASLDEDWKLASATNKLDYFEVFSNDKPELKLIYKFDAEVKSLLSANLWEMGWYFLIQHELRKAISGKRNPVRKKLLIVM